MVNFSSIKKQKITQVALARVICSSNFHNFLKRKMIILCLLSEFLVIIHLQIFAVLRKLTFKICHIWHAKMHLISW